MALETYRRKRNFAKTVEPRGRKAGRTGCSYVVQKHAARRLHYDFRLELDGVLKSWAVTKGPSLVPGERRLAVHVEDHPLEYGEFEGTIPKGEYGGGEVIIWDRGSWTPIGDARRGYAKGHLDFDLAGEKLKGRWHLVRMRGRRGEARENWLLIKGDDTAARAPSDPDILEQEPESVTSGRRVEMLKGEAPGWSSKTGPVPRAKQKATKRKADVKSSIMPEFIAPQLATLATKTPRGARWVHEIKFDGYRIQARIESGNVMMRTRSGLDWSEKFGTRLPTALAHLPCSSALIDGELVVENAYGASDFSALQGALSKGAKSGYIYYAFDLLFLNGKDLREESLAARKAALEALLKDVHEPIRYSIHFESRGEAVLRHACRLSLEGVVSKLKKAAYRSGRSKEWVKTKCTERQEFVIAGLVPSSVSKSAIGSLVLGYYDAGKLVYAGRVGTGYSRAAAHELFKILTPLRRDGSPFARKLASSEARGVMFVEPKIVAEVEFRGWTAEENLRHASFRGVREDKSAHDVVREGNPVAVPRTLRSAVTLTHPDRLFWPEAGVTKEGLAYYYADMWARMAPFVVHRLLALVRCPEGITQQCFFQKHAWNAMGRSVRQTNTSPDSSGKPGLYIDDRDGVIALVQAGVLEIHPWGSTLADVELPDVITMDLDPGEGVSWRQMIEAAQDVRARLVERGLTAFVKTSGGKGLHVVAPLRPRADWVEVKAFTKRLADQMAADSPDRYVSKITKSRRGGKILVDYLRNGRGATAVAPYSTRARPGAPVSMPLDWDELTPSIGPAYFTVANARARLEIPDPWAGFFKAAEPLRAKPGAKARR